MYAVCHFDYHLRGDAIITGHTAPCVYKPTKYHVCGGNEHWTPWWHGSFAGWRAFVTDIARLRACCRRVCGHACRARGLTSTFSTAYSPAREYAAPLMFATLQTLSLRGLLCLPRYLLRAKPPFCDYSYPRLTAAASPRRWPRIMP